MHTAAGAAAPENAEKFFRIFRRRRARRSVH